MRNPEPQVWPALSKTNAERIIRLVSPKPGYHDHCLRGAKVSVEWITRETAAAQSPGQRKKALINVAKKVDSAIKSIEALPLDTRYEIDPKALLHQLQDRIGELAEKITVPRSGGKKIGQGNLIDAAKKRAAADCAESMIETWGSKPLTLAKYRKLTALLFKLATGKAGDVKRACRAQRQRSAQGKVVTSPRMIMEEADAGKGISTDPADYFPARRSR
jgi:hypothetical protein